MVRKSFLVNVYPNMIPDLENRLRAELEGTDIYLVKVTEGDVSKPPSEKIQNIVSAEYEYAPSKTKTANRQKEEESEYCIRAATDKLYTESYEQIQKFDGGFIWRIQLS